VIPNFASCNDLKDGYRIIFFSILLKFLIKYSILERRRDNQAGNEKRIKIKLVLAYIFKLVLFSLVSFSDTS